MTNDGNRQEVANPAFIGFQSFHEYKRRMLTRQAHEQEKSRLK